MHELAIAQSIFDTALKALDAESLDHIESIGVRIGRLTDVHTDSLLFGFEALSRDSRLSGARLNIEDIPIVGVCSQCACETEFEDIVLRCPKCGSGDVDLIHGMELEVAYIEGPDTSQPDT